MLLSEKSFLMTHHALTSSLQYQNKKSPAPVGQCPSRAGAVIEINYEDI